MGSPHSIDSAVLWVQARGFCIDPSKKLLRSRWARSVVCAVWELTGAIILGGKPVAHLDIDPLWEKSALIRATFSSIRTECFDPAPQQVHKCRLSGWVVHLLCSLLEKKPLKRIRLKFLYMLNSEIAFSKMKLNGIYTMYSEVHT